MSNTIRDIGNYDVPSIRENEEAMAVVSLHHPDLYKDSPEAYAVLLSGVMNAAAIRGQTRVIAHTMDAVIEKLNYISQSIEDLASGCDMSDTSFALNRIADAIKEGGE